MELSIRDLMNAGAHFGHRTRFWNPKMAPYIYGARNRTHIINLEHTRQGLAAAADFLAHTAMNDGRVLMVCSKRQAEDIVQSEAERCGSPFVNHRWLGGLLTNFAAVKKSVEQLNKMEAQIKDGSLKEMTKKEGIRLVLRRDKLMRSLGGVRDMASPADALFVVDAGMHRGAILEANKLNIPVAAVVDTNHSPAGIDHVIPGNDDSREAIAAYFRAAADAVLNGKARAREREVAAAAGEEPPPPDM